MVSEIIYCPHLNRDIRGLLNAVPNPRIATGYPTEKGHDGCLESHKDIIRRARMADEPFVFVMEDDCQFTDIFIYDDWLLTVEDLAGRGADLLVGGCVNTYQPRKCGFSSPYQVVEVDKFHSAHCIVYFESGYERALDAIQPWDTSLGDQGLRTFMTWPFVAIQRPTYSGILQRDVDYTGFYKVHEEHLGNLLGLRA
jgi:hypothetical protein